MHPNHWHISMTNREQGKSDRRAAPAQAMAKADGF
jgi:hypothetical protein